MSFEEQETGKEKIIWALFERLSVYMLASSLQHISELLLWCGIVWLVFYMLQVRQVLPNGCALDAC